MSWLLPEAESTADLLTQGWDESLIPSAQFEVAPPAASDVGSDLEFWDDVTEHQSVYSADDPMVVAQDCYHRLQTPRGLLPDAPDWGTDLSEWLLSGIPKGGTQTIERVIVNELRKDDRLLSVTVAVENVDREYRIEIRGTVGAGPFRLVMAVTDSETLLKEVTRG